MKIKQLPGLHASWTYEDKLNVTSALSRLAGGYEELKRQREELNCLTSKSDCTCGHCMVMALLPCLAKEQT